MQNRDGRWNHVEVIEAEWSPDDDAAHLAAIDPAALYHAILQMRAGVAPHRINVWI